MLAAAMSGLFANFFSTNAIVPSVGREYIQESRPRANMFFDRPASLRESSPPSSASSVICVRSRACTEKPSRVPSVIGFEFHPMRASARSLKSCVSMIKVAPLGMSPRLAFRAAGFIATRTSGRSPGVRMS